MTPLSGSAGSGVSPLLGLMPYQIQDILLVSTEYDSFIVDEDGMLAERIVDHYLELRLPTIPRLHFATDGPRALAMLAKGRFEMAICMARLPETPAPTLARQLREAAPDLPVVVLTYTSLTVTELAQHPDWGEVDSAWVWRGDARLILAIIKSVEDRRNARADTRDHGVGVILVVEDSPLYVSTLLPHLYTVVLDQTRLNIADGLNLSDRLYRTRARPRILLARDYDEACSLYAEFEPYLLALITDRSLPRGDRQDRDAGLSLIRLVRERHPDVPILLNSSTVPAGRWDEELQVAAVDKHDPELFERVSDFIVTNCGFGDFVFRLPSGREVGRARSAAEMHETLKYVSGEALLYHARHNHLSRWLMARSEYRLARRFRDVDANEFDSPESLRAWVVEALDELHDGRQRGAILDFAPGASHLDRDFVRLGEGSLGGKGRGVAFVYKLLADSDIHERYPGIDIHVPRTAVICTGEFERFVRDARLHDLLERDASDEEIVHRFLDAPGPTDMEQDLAALLADLQYPLAIRSSSLLEDAHFRPFAGVYATHLRPNNHRALNVRHAQLCRAVRLVFASTWSSAARTCMRATSHRLGEEAMAVLVQRVVGRQRGERFYPTLSGVAQSHNFYPVGHQRSEDGVVTAALGLGRTVVGGGRSLRFSPAHPLVQPQLSSPAAALRNTQRGFWALDMGRAGARVSVDETGTLVYAPLSVAEEDGTLAHVGSTWVPNEDRIYPGTQRPGTRLLTLAPILELDTFPLAALLGDILALTSEAMGCPVEFEFVAQLDPDPASERLPELAIVQLRPLTAAASGFDVDLEAFEPADIVIRSARALGSGAIEGLRDVVFVHPDGFESRDSRAIAAEIASVNVALTNARRPYLLMGPGRWGTQDDKLGVPVDWSQVSGARVIVELAFAGFDIDPSQGTHFFHNITSLGVGYLALDPRRGDESIDWSMFTSAPDATPDLNYVRHVRLEEPVRALLDGSHGVGLVVR